MPTGIPRVQKRTTKKQVDLSNPKLLADLPIRPAFRADSYDTPSPPPNTADIRAVFYFKSGGENGLGHKYRCLSLANDLRNRGYTARFVTNTLSDWGSRHFGGVMIPEHLQAEDEQWVKPGLVDAMHGESANWLIVDLADEPAPFVYYAARECGCRVALLNGVGHAHEGELADIVWIQDSPQTVLIRQEVMRLVREPGEEWFVFGGAADELGLRSAFLNASKLPAVVLQTEHCEPLKKGLTRSYQHVETVNNGDILYYMAICGKALVHMGMTAWELAVLGVPTYVVSRSTEHLRFALNMEQLGLVKAWPEVGLPSSVQMRAWLAEQFEPNQDNRPDGHGGELLIGKMLNEYPV